jgi:ketosteroid isomerase-like protein
MSQENVELLRQTFSAYNAAFLTGDLAAFLSRADPDVEWHSATEVMDPIYRGREGVRRWMTEFFESWDAVRVEPEGFLHAGPDRVLVALRLRGKGKGSGIDTDMLLHELMTIRNGRIIERRPFRSRAEALEAAGLSEQDAHADSS